MTVQHLSRPALISAAAAAAQNPQAHDRSNQQNNSPPQAPLNPGELSGHQWGFLLALDNRARQLRTVVAPNERFPAALSGKPAGRGNRPPEHRIATPGEREEEQGEEQGLEQQRQDEQRGAGAPAMRLEEQQRDNGVPQRSKVQTLGWGGDGVSRLLDSERNNEKQASGSQRPPK
jgi:hypothetical protein